MIRRQTKLPKGSLCLIVPDKLKALTCRVITCIQCPETKTGSDPSGLPETGAHLSNSAMATFTSSTMRIITNEQHVQSSPSGWNRQGIHGTPWTGNPFPGKSPERIASHSPAHHRRQSRHISGNVHPAGNRHRQHSRYMDAYADSLRPQASPAKLRYQFLAAIKIPINR